MHLSRTVLFLLLIPLVLQARTLHVSPRPMDGIAAGDQFRGISDAAKNVAAGDTVLIHGGTYREVVVVEASGTEQAPILFQAAPGEHVVVTGADLIVDWKSEEPAGVFSTPWPHVFIGWNPTHTHPGDDVHLLVGRCEQVLAEHYPLRQVLSRSALSRGTFFVDLEQKRLYVQTVHNSNLAKGQARIEASVRQGIWHNKGAWIHVRGLRFRYAANMAQHGAVQISGPHNTLSDCTIEDTNSVGLGIDSPDALVLRCTLQYNGQLGLGAGGAHNLVIRDCTIRGNSTKGWDRGWEAGGDKICASRNVLIEHSRFVENRGNGIWFDIGNENAVIRNCLVADNEDAGIFYEISFGLHAHDNVIIGNGFDASGGAWGAAAGIALSSSPNCRVERNLLVGNKEGFNYREQMRTTPLIGQNNGGVAVWNHDQAIERNIIAFNRDAQTWGWFDVSDGRHWPAAMQASLSPNHARPGQDIAQGYNAKDNRSQPAGLSLEKLALKHGENVYFAAVGQGMFNWGTAWAVHRAYALADAQRELGLEKSSVVAEPHFADLVSRDLRIPADSPAAIRNAYPRGDVPGVALGFGQ